MFWAQATWIKDIGVPLDSHIIVQVAEIEIRAGKIPFFDADLEYRVDYAVDKLFNDIAI